MKTGQRVIKTEEAKPIDLFGNQAEFKKGENIKVSLISRRDGICEVEGKGQFKCNQIKGISAI